MALKAFLSINCQFVKKLLYQFLFRVFKKSGRSNRLNSNFFVFKTLEHQGVEKLKRAQITCVLLSKIFPIQLMGLTVVIETGLICSGVGNVLLRGI